MPYRCWLGWCLVVLVGAATPAAEPVAVTVSPGGPESAVIEDSCPTFAWRPAAKAVTYELVVYRVEEEGEQLEAVIEESVDGSWTSWAPADEACLGVDGRYAWAVRALVGEEATDWSEPALFELLTAPGAATQEPPPRWIDRGDGTVLDAKTGLVWLAQSDCIGAVGGLLQASRRILELGDGECGLSDGSSQRDWRLPTREEWEATLDPGCRPAIGDGRGGCWSSARCQPDCAFSGVLRASYWSSTKGTPFDELNRSAATDLWVADLGQGHMETAGPHDGWIHAWPVRGPSIGPSALAALEGLRGAAASETAGQSEPPDFLAPVEITSHDGRTLEEWSARLRAGSAFERGEAVRALVAFGPKAAPALIEGLRSNSEESIRSLCMGALFDVGPLSDDALRAVLGALADPSPIVRVTAAMAAYEGLPARIDARRTPVLIEMTRHAEAQVRVLSVQLLGMLGPGAGAALGTLSDLADQDPEPQVREIARAVAERLGGS